VLKFSYGLNIDAARMRELAPAIRFLHRAHLPDHTVGFTVMYEGIPQEDAVPAPGSQLWGVLYELPDGPEVDALDTAEGIQKDGASRPEYPNRRELRTVVTETGREVQAYMYVAGGIENLEPDRGYVARVLEWAKFWSLPAEHVAVLESHLNRSRDWGRVDSR
jgi:hypothetical protein